MTFGAWEFMSKLQESFPGARLLGSSYAVKEGVSPQEVWESYRSPSSLDFTIPVQEVGDRPYHVKVEIRGPKESGSYWWGSREDFSLYIEGRHGRYYDDVMDQEYRRRLKLGRQDDNLKEAKFNLDLTKTLKKATTKVEEVLKKVQEAASHQQEHLDRRQAQALGLKGLGAQVAQYLGLPTPQVEKGWRRHNLRASAYSFDKIRMKGAELTLGQDNTLNVKLPLLRGLDPRTVSQILKVLEDAAPQTD